MCDQRVAKHWIGLLTVAILAQGTSWAVAVTQAFLPLFGWGYHVFSCYCANAAATFRNKYQLVTNPSVKSISGPRYVCFEIKCVLMHSVVEVMRQDVIQSA